MRLVLCDDHRILAEALAAALGKHGHQVLAVTTTATAGVTAVAVHHPDICLLDLRFPDAENGLDAARAIAGLIPKDQSIDQIADALDVVAAGGAVFDTGLHRGMASRRQAQRSTQPLERLTPREREILARIVDGQSTKQMARAMSITIGTAGIYVRNVLTKLGVHSRLQAAALASRQGLLDQLRPGEAWFPSSGPVNRLSRSRLEIPA
jgi:two-component system nitrate/nitrite response regulator NarL